MLEMSQIDKIFIKGQLCRMETKVCPLGFFLSDVCHLSHYLTFLMKEVKIFSDTIG